MEAANPITRKVLNWFEEITKVPRCSKNEEQIGQWLLDWAEQNSFKSKKDAAGNIVIQVPGTTGYENSPTLVIQGHMDMVCEKTPESTHDFSKDPIEMVFEGEWLTANQTTLGADNGIAIAIALAMVLDETVEHPPSSRKTSSRARFFSTLTAKTRASSPSVAPVVSIPTSQFRWNSKPLLRT